MKNPPAFQFYPADFLVGIMGMSDGEVGIYIKMLSYQWLHGDLPNCGKTIKKLINSDKKPSEKVMEKFQKIDEKTIRNLRLEEVREKQKSFAESRKNNANNRWKKDASASAVHDSSICKNDALHSSSSSSSSIIVQETTPARKSAPISEPETPWPASASERGGRMHAIMKRINSLRPEWQMPFQWNAIEMHALQGGAAAQICELTDDDWRDLESYMSATGLPKDYWQPRSRLKFVETFSDVCAGLQRWRHKGHGSNKKIHPLNPYA